MTSGLDVFDSGMAKYAAAGPLFYTAYLFVAAILPLSAKTLKWSGLIAHPLSVPAVVVSFMHLGYLLPILALLWFDAYRQVRREERVRRGLCSACAYPIGTSEVCTECGAAVPRSVKTSKRQNVESS